MHLQDYELWFLTGSQHLYGPEAIEQVAEHSREIAAALDASGAIPTRVVFKPVLTTAEEIHQICQEANAAQNCVGVVAWMHTFSPAKNWIAGLRALQKPLAHLHTQYNRDIPWGEIDMDFMNLNQAAHGDREFGFMMSRMRASRKVIVGYWQEAAIQDQLGAWARAACGWHVLQTLKVARFGDNMRSVAVTEGDKVEAQLRLGCAVNGYGVGDLVEHVNATSDAQINELIDEALNGIEAAFEGAIQAGVAGALGDSDNVYDAILEAAYAGVKCPARLNHLSDDRDMTLIERLKQLLCRLPPGTEVVFIEHHQVPVQQVQPLILGFDISRLIPAKKILKGAEID